jgi:hypothetical protein
MYTMFPLFVLEEKPEPEMIRRVPPASDPLWMCVCVCVCVCVYVCMYTGYCELMCVTHGVLWCSGVYVHVCNVSLTLCAMVHANTERLYPCV